jgi:adhesin HecA-like repeat protein
MTTHELAMQLLAGKNVPVQLQVNTNNDGFWGAEGDVTITSGQRVTVLRCFQEEATGVQQPGD